MQERPDVPLLSAQRQQVAPVAGAGQGDLRSPGQDAGRLHTTVALLTIVAATACEHAAFKVLMDRAANYRYLLLLLSIALHVVVFASAHWYQRCRADTVPSELCSTPKRWLIFIAMLDLAQGALLVEGAAGTTPTLSVLLLQLQWPMTALATVLVLRTKYSLTQSMGVAITAAGCVLGVMVVVTPPGHVTAERTSLLASGLYASHALPAALSLACKSRLLCAHPTDMTYLNACLSALQLLLGAVLLPLGLLLQGRLDAGRATGATSELFRGFVACFIAGRDSLDGDMCKWSFALLLVYLLAHAAAAYYTLALLGKSRGAADAAPLVGAVVAFGLLLAYQLSDSTWIALGFGRLSAFDLCGFAMAIAGIVAFLRAAEHPAGEMVTELPQEP